MYQLILLLHVIVALMIIGLVLIQHGKGADIGASFGSGASTTVFGSQGTGGFLFRLTGGLALLFFVTSLLLSYMVSMQAYRAHEAAIPHGVEKKSATIPIPSEESVLPPSSDDANR